MRIFLLLCLFGTAIGGVTGCATRPPLPIQPAPSEPFAILTFSRAMQLISLDDQRFDSGQPIRSLRVKPGSHELRFIHLNEGPEGSAAHAGQLTDPFTLDAHEGITYEFEAKT